MTDVERVARAICKASNENPDYVSKYQESNDPVWMTYVPQAKAAISAMGTDSSPSPAS